MGHPDHGSREKTERLSYERARQAGIPQDAARKIAQDAAVQTHREQDRLNSDRKTSKR